MSLRPLMPMLIALLFASAGTMVSAVAQANGWMSAFSAGLYAIALVAAALRVNAPLWPREAKDEDAGPDLEATAVRRNARLAAVLYGWGAAAMFGIYTLSGLHWRHGWQYGAAMALIAAGLLAYAHRVETVGTILRSARGLRAALIFTLVHGAAAAIALVWLIASGKVWSSRPDWAANHVFVAGTLTIVALCVIAAWTQWRLGRRLSGA